MSEMLGNQYFMARKYADALAELEPCLIEDPENKTIKRKLVICYTQIGKIEKAMDLFTELVNEDIEFILNADPVKDDCPCTELVENLDELNLLESRDFYTLSGILWLYCDYKKSLLHFAKAAELSPDNKAVKNVYDTIRRYLEMHPELN